MIAAELFSLNQLPIQPDSAGLLPTDSIRRRITNAQRKWLDTRDKASVFPIFTDDGVLSGFHTRQRKTLHPHHIDPVAHLKWHAASDAYHNHPINLIQLCNKHHNKIDADYDPTLRAIHQTSNYFEIMGFNEFVEKVVIPSGAPFWDSRYDEVLSNMAVFNSAMLYFRYGLDWLPFGDTEEQQNRIAYDIVGCYDALQQYNPSFIEMYEPVYREIRGI